MKLTFTDIHWRNSDDSDIFNIHAIQSIELDIDKNIVTIVGAAGTYKSPFCDLTYGGGVTHFEILAMHPFHMGEYINIAIFEHKGTVCIAHHSNASEGRVDAWFDYHCRTFVNID